jgi:hypothetical protein
MNQTPYTDISNSNLSAEDIKKFIARINELDALSTYSYMPVHKLDPRLRKYLYKQFDKYIPTVVKPQKT